MDSVPVRLEESLEGCIRRRGGEGIWCVNDMRTGCEEASGLGRLVCILPAMTNIVPSDWSLAGLFSETGRSGLSRSS